MREPVTITNPGGWTHSWNLWISPEGKEYRETSPRETPDLIIVPNEPNLKPLRLRVYNEPPSYKRRNG